MIKKLLQFSLANKFAIFLMTVLIILGGVYASVKMKLELLPDVEPPMITVQTTMPSATPETVKDEISDKIDDQVRSMANVSSVNAQSVQNASLVTIEYEDKTNMDKAENDLKKELDKIDFSDDVQEPELMRSSMDEFPIVAYSLTHNDGDLKDTTQKINDELIPKLQTIKGVQNAQLNGQTNREVSLKFDKAALREHGLTEDGVQQYIKNASGKTPLGLFQFDNTEKSIIIDGEFESVNALKNMQIPTQAAQSSASASQQGESGGSDSSDSEESASSGGSDSQSAASSAALSSSASSKLVKLSEIADVSVGDERESISKTNGKDAVIVQITKAQDANTVQVANDVKVDQDKATEKGISAAQLALVLNENMPEQTITKVKDKGNSIDVKVKQDKQNDWSKQKLENTSFPSPTGDTVKLGDIATLEHTSIPNKIETKAGDYTATVTGKVTNEDVGGTSRDVIEKANAIETPKNVSVNVGGATDDIDDAIEQLSIAMLAAVIIVYLVLVLTFKGALAPFTILFSLPYTVIGVIEALLITGETVSVPTMIGMLMLIGIVVTNAIVLIDRVVNKQQEGLAMKEALLEAGATRIRPILMTALATIGALLPMLFGQDNSVLISKGLAATVIGGLVSSTLLTLIVVPVIYEVIFTLKDKVTRLFSRQKN
ncbi:MAG TPA: efflux RND transporter permease subunit [Staphylococcus auricularis]|uniref:efflux RND transporter permease subunit n=1 Tax=Staphylococcus auricularis TaxID=29379 RepID=UPI0012468FC3|nr:efflux RND transporter permease subunit [Staphylococcus auricularis]HJE00916.1 efflux RND transporter permease subunit [Staphylococcus auricularis]